MEDSIFYFADKPPPAVQDKNVCSAHWEAINLLKDEESVSSSFERMKAVGNEDILWYPAFGAALVINKTDTIHVSLNIVGLDNWSNYVHASESTRTPTTIPDVTRPCLLNAVHVNRTTLDNTLAKFHKEIYRDRNSDKKLHRTPAFLHAQLLKYVEHCKGGYANIYGGTTDVGQHTNCELRNISFPLALSVLKAFLCFSGDEGNENFYQIVCLYLLPYLKKMVAHPDSLSNRLINRAFVAIRQISIYAKKIRSHDFQRRVYNELKSARGVLDNIQPLIDQCKVNIPIVSHEEATSQLTPIAVPEMNVTASNNAKDKLSQSRADAKINLNWASLDDAGIKDTVQDAWVQLSRLNEKFWSSANQLREKQIPISCSDIASMKSMVTQHVKWTNIVMKASATSHHIMKVNLKSNRLLAIWITYCWAHRVAVIEHKQLEEYNVTLDPDDLKNIVLKDKHARDALRSVRNYLKQYRQFNLTPFRSQVGTLSLASDISGSLPEYDKWLLLHEEYYKRKIEERYTLVKQIQSRLAELDRDLIEAKRQLSSAQSNVDWSETRDYHWGGYCNNTKCYTSTYYDYVRKRDECKSKVQSIQDLIRNEENKRPSNLELPLPRNRDVAKQWMFFLSMPSKIRNVAEFARLGEAELHGKDLSNNADIKIDFYGWYTNRQGSNIYDIKSPSILSLGSKRTYEREKQPNIRNYQRETCVLFPDKYNVHFSYLSCDPFITAQTTSSKTCLFTEELPECDRSTLMQKYMPMLPSAERGNLGIASKENIPNWLNTEQYLAFSTLRAYPHIQIRKLVSHLIESTLPFDHKCVHVLIRQALYQAGESSWSDDIKQNWQGMALFNCFMKEEIENVRYSPKYNGSLIIFGAITSFLGQYSDNLLTRNKEFSIVAKGWADGVGTQIRKKNNVLPELYKRQAEYYASALLCFNSINQLHEKDCQLLAELIVLYRNRALFAKGTVDICLDEAIQQIMSAHVHSLANFAVSRHVFLCNLIRLVIDDFPLQANWAAVRYDEATNTGCFESVVGNTLYSINLLNGNVLVDGVPPGVLPHSVTSNKLYKLTFGNRNFEIIGKGFRHYQTTRRVDDCYTYEFIIDKNDILHIIEFEGNPEDTDRKSLLLQQDDIELPVILKRKFSHWYDMVNKAAVLRRHGYNERCVEYIVTDVSTYVVPVERRDESVVELLSNVDSFDRVMNGISPLIPILERFEQHKYIHTVVFAKDDCIKYIFERFGLAFEYREDEVRSCNFKGHQLDSTQQLNGTLPALTQYLVLTQNGKKKVLFPNGKVINDGIIEIDGIYSAKLSYFSYDIHPRFLHLIAPSTTARLFLAALYASSSTFLPEANSRYSGFDTATELVRQCWSNEVLDETEKLLLEQITRYSKLSCTLSLICSWLWQSATQYWFLYCENTPESETLRLDPLAVNEYRTNSFVKRLLSTEEKYLLAYIQPPVKSIRHKLHVDTDYVNKAEEELYSQVSFSSRTSNNRQKLPLQCTGTSTVDYDFFKDLEDSWNEYCNCPQMQLHFDSDQIADMMKHTSEIRVELEKKLRNELTEIPHTNYGFDQVTDRVHHATAFDILQCSWDDEHFNKLRLPLTVEELSTIRYAALEWMCLCVLEDRLERIISLSRRSEWSKDVEEQIMTELQCRRNWNPCTHPRWLAFEVEQQLQIRQHQYSIVEQLLNNKGTVTQLNMGQGKTRVLIPMLILELTYRKDCLVRVNTLASILEEAKHFYRNVLVASHLRTRIFSLPFHRDIDLDEKLADVLSEMMDRCKYAGGAMIMSPQDRNSLLLKQYDVDAFVSALQDTKSIDIIDETDAILDHGFQLVYSTGERMSLPDGQSRWKVLQALLTIMSRCDDSPHLGQYLTNQKLLHREPRTYGSYPNIRFYSDIDTVFNQSEFNRDLCQQFLVDPLPGFEWIKQIPKTMVDSLTDVISNPSFRDVAEVIESHPLLNVYQSEILAARGYIAYGLLLHSLFRRHRVHYGVKRIGRKHMAVPFAACETPKERAEFNHPDMAVIYTMLSYLHDGLTLPQFVESVKLLQSLGLSSQNYIYDTWISAVKHDVPADKLAKFDTIKKVDTGNELLVKVMWTYLRRCIETVCYWLQNFVFPNETQQFASRRITSAWNLTDTGNCIGFSGTDDNRFLLPLFVRQVPQNDIKLRATNGMMIDKIMKCTEPKIMMIKEVIDDTSQENKSLWQAAHRFLLPGFVKQVPQNDIKPRATNGMMIDETMKCTEVAQKNKSLWQAVLTQCLKTNCSALIDVSGLMAGTTNSQVASYLASRTASFKGIVYFNTTHNTWNVFETLAKRDVPLSSSSVLADECFAYYDESRCRGSDLKLDRKAKAMVTLDANLTKDKFLQGCARMRALGPEGQRLVLAGTHETAGKISTVQPFMQKLLQNTVDRIKDGLFEFYERGRCYYLFPKETKDDYTLETMYQSAMTVYANISHYLELNSEKVTESTKLLVYCKDLGKDNQVTSSSLGEECEREVEREIECETEQEIEIPKQSPYSEVSWQYEKVFVNPDTLFETDFLRLSSSIHNRIKELQGLHWDDNLWCTKNFIHTITADPEELSLYLRPVDAFLLVNNRVVLLSEYDTENLLPYWRKYNKNAKAKLLHLSTHARENVKSGFGYDQVAVPIALRAQMKLFRGHVQYSKDECKELDSVFGDKAAKPYIEKLLNFRSRLHLLEKSTLDRYSNDQHLKRLAAMAMVED